MEGVGGRSAWPTWRGDRDDEAATIRCSVAYRLRLAAARELDAWSQIKGNYIFDSPNDPG